MDPPQSVHDLHIPLRNQDRHLLLRGTVYFAAYLLLGHLLTLARSVLQPGGAFPHTPTKRAPGNRSSPFRRDLTPSRVKSNGPTRENPFRGQSHPINGSTSYVYGLYLRECLVLTDCLLQELTHQTAPQVAFFFSAVSAAKSLNRLRAHDSPNPKLGGSFRDGKIGGIVRHQLFKNIVKWILYAIIGARIKFISSALR